MPVWLNYLITSALSGAVTAFASCATMGGHTDWAHCGTMAGVGAAVGAVNLFRQAPAATKAP